MKPPGQNDFVVHSNATKRCTITVQMGRKGMVKKKSFSLKKQANTETKSSYSVQKYEKKTHPCSFCDFVCQSSSDLDAHQQILHRKDHLYSCNLCHYICGKPSLLSLHMLTHSGSMKISCVQCNMKFTHIYYLRRHLQKHLVQEKQKQTKKFTCSYCKKMFCWKINYRKHIKTHTSLSVYKCVLCDFSTNQIADLFDHKHSHENKDGFFSCNQCQGCLPSVTSLDVHMLLNHKESYLKITNSEQGSTCNLCGKLFYKFSDMQRHMIRTCVKECLLSAKDEKLKLELIAVLQTECLCSTCGTILPTPSTLKTHKCKNVEKTLFICTTCQRKFPTSSRLKNHEYLHTGQKPFLCSLCPYRCRQKQYLKRHILTHSGEKTHLCPVCGEDFLFPETLKRHMHKHSSEQPYSCKLCSYCTSDINRLKQHMAKHVTDIFSCDVCTFTCAKSCDMKTHKLSHLLNKLIPCSSCGLKLSNSKELQSHMLKHLEQNIPNYTCSHCSFKCQIQKEYITHMQTHSIDKPFLCTECGYCSNRRMNLKVHMIKKHKLSLASVVTFKCEICQFACERIQDYIRHMTINHNIDKPFNCPVCSFTTHRQSLLKIHQETHKLHEFFCSLCNFKCKRKTLLNKHLAMKHLTKNLDTDSFGHKFYFCKLCNFKSKHYASLRNHMPAHSDTKFKCDKCNYVTYAKRNLTSHLRTHMTDKPFKCNFCSYSSARKNNFKLHMVRHMNEKLYFCDKCNFSSNEESKLIEHIHSHSSCFVTDEEVSENIEMLNEMSSTEETKKIQFEAVCNTFKENTQVIYFQGENLKNNATDGEKQTKSLQFVVNGVSVENAGNVNKAQEANKVQRHTGYKIIKGIDLQSVCQDQNVVDAERHTKSVYPVVNVDLSERVSKLHVKSCESETSKTQQTSDSRNMKDNFIQDGNQKKCVEVDVVEQSQSQHSAVKIFSSETVEKLAQRLSQVEVVKLKNTTVCRNINDKPPYSDCHKNCLEKCVGEDGTKQFRSRYPDLTTEFSDNDKVLSIKCKSEANRINQSTDYKSSKEFQSNHEENIPGMKILKHLKSQQPFISTWPSTNAQTLPQILDKTETKNVYPTSNYRIVADLDYQGKFLEHNIRMTVTKPSSEFDNNCSVHVEKTTNQKSHSVNSSLALGERYVQTSNTEHCATGIDLSSFVQPPTNSVEQVFNFPTSLTSVKNNKQMEYTADLTVYVPNDCIQKTSHYQDLLHVHFTPNRDPGDSKHQQNASSKNMNSVDHTEAFMRFAESELLIKGSINHEQNNDTCHTDLNETLHTGHSLSHHVNGSSQRIPVSSFPVGDNSQKVQVSSHHVDNPEISNSVTLEPDVAQHNGFSTAEATTCLTQSSTNLWRENVLSCTLCSFHCSNEKDFQLHSLTHSLTVSQITLSFSCSNCQSLFNSTEEYDRHCLRCQVGPTARDDRLDQENSDTISAQISTAESTQTVPQKKGKYYTCSKCNYVSDRPGNFKHHMLSMHDIEKAFSCTLCSYSTKREDDLKTHAITHDDKAIKSCSICNYTCKRIPALRKHLQKHKDIKLFSCKSCDFWCNYEPDMKTHIFKIHEKTKKFTCHVCTYSTDIAIHFKKHMEEAHKIEKAFKCAECDYSSPLWNNFRAHKLKHTTLKKHVCVFCGLSFKRLASLKIHTYKHSLSKTLKCSRCKYQSFLPEKLKIHMRQHMNERPYSCKICQRSYIHSSSLSKHFHSLHNDRKRYACSECSHTTASITQLKRHNRTHGVGNLIQCRVCDFFCSHSEILKNHMLLHSNTGGSIPSNETKMTTAFHCLSNTITSSVSGNVVSTSDCSLQNNLVSYKCSEYLQNFSNSTGLKTHIQEHEKSHIVHRLFCSVCEFSCLRHHELKIHTSFHTGEKQFVCNMCNYACNKPYTLKYHKHKHHGLACHSNSVTVFTCHKCDFTCNKRIYLKYHFQKKHKIFAMVLQSTENSTRVTKNCKKVTNLSENSGIASENCHLTKNCKSVCAMSENVSLSSENETMCGVSENVTTSNENCKSACAVSGNGATSNENCKTVCECVMSENCDALNENCKPVFNSSKNVTKFTQSSENVVEQSFVKHMLLERTQTRDSSQNDNRSSLHSRTVITTNSQNTNKVITKISQNNNTLTCSLSHNNNTNNYSISQNINIPNFSPAQNTNIINYSTSQKTNTCNFSSQNTNSAVKQFTCTECTYTCTTNRNFRTHLLLHKNKNFLCHLCDYMCRRERELKRHLLTHASTKPLSCGQCSYTCIQPASLKVHMLRHKGEKPIQCKICEFRCRQKSTLRDHMMTHSDIRMFACVYCDYQAKRAVSLKMHLLTHSSERPVCCTLCDFTCKHLNALKSHMRTHLA